jgi:hypothetical protein
MATLPQTRAKTSAFALHLSANLLQSLYFSITCEMPLYPPVVTCKSFLKSAPRISRSRINHRSAAPHTGHALMEASAILGVVEAYARLQAFLCDAVSFDDDSKLSAEDRGMVLQFLSVLAVECRISC